MLRPLLIAALILLLPLPAPATTPLLPRVSAEQARQFTRARLADGYELLLGPSVPAVAPVPALDCQALYAARANLMRAELDYRPAFWDESRHGAAVFIGAIWTPAFYYLPYRALATTLADEGRTRQHAELDALRAAAAAQRCFER